MSPLRKKLALMLLLTSIPLSCRAADSASSTVDSWVGLQSPFRVICTSVNFGVWFVPTGDRGGSTIISLDTESGTTDTVVSASGAGSDRLAVIQDRGYTSPLAGVCNIKGSLANNNDSLTVGFEGATNASISLKPAQHIFAQGLAAASEGAALSVSLRTPETGRTSVLVTDGEAVFRVVGELTIPNNISRSNYGAYKSNQTATVVVSDGIGD